MSAQTQIPDAAFRSPGQPMYERTACYTAGPVLVTVDFVLLVATIIAFQQSAVHKSVAEGVLVVVGIVLAIAVVTLLRGITVVAPGRAHVVQLFGKYKGTIREPGMQWVNPFANRIPVSTRIRNLETAEQATQRVVNTGSLYS